LARILVVDDDGHIREVVRFALEQAGHDVREAADGRAALAAFAAEPPELVVLDIVMPDPDGIEVCRELRRTSRVPIVFLSSRDEELDRVLGLEIGGDDYVTKPFSPRELVARVKAVLRRGAAPDPPEAADARDASLRRGEVSLDPVRHRCRLGAHELTLTVTEFDLLACLMGTAGKVYSRAELVERAWGGDVHVTERTIDSHVRRLRAKFAALGADPIETVYGVGYRLRE
jgi:two-component system OmpR family response regulator